MKSLWGNDDFSLGHDDFSMGMMKWLKVIKTILMKNTFFETIDLFVSCVFALQTDVTLMSIAILASVTIDFSHLIIDSHVQDDKEPKIGPSKPIFGF